MIWANSYYKTGGLPLSGLFPLISSCCHHELCPLVHQAGCSFQSEFYFPNMMSTGYKTANPSGLAVGVEWGSDLPLASEVKAVLTPGA